MVTSEDAHRTQLIEVLNKKLPNKYKAYNSANVQIPKNHPIRKRDGKQKREFDIYIIHQDYIGEDTFEFEHIIASLETKNVRSADIGIGQCEDSFSVFQNMIYGYATNFESFYRRERNKVSNTSILKQKSINQRIDKIAEIVSEDIKSFIALEKAKQESIGLNENEALEILKNCMNRIQVEMTELTDERLNKLEEKTGLLWARKLDKNSYSTDDSISRLKYDVKRAASYILVDQFLFYHLLQVKNQSRFDQLKVLDVKSPIFFDGFFQQVRRDDYNAIYGIDVLGVLPKSRKVVNAINKVIKTIVSSEIDKISVDILGKIFHNMIPLEIRKRIAAFYTSNSAGRLLANLSIKEFNSKVVDLTCGSGTLLVESYIVKDKLYKKFKPEISFEEIHKQIISELYGNDVSIFAAHLATMNLARQKLEVFTNKVNISIGDGLEIAPEDKLIRLDKFIYNTNYEKRKEAIGSNLDGEKYLINYPIMDCVIMNPPFSQQKDMNEDTIAHFDILMKEYNLSKYVDKKMGLHGYFILHMDQFLKKGGILSLVLPASTFTSDYSKKLLKFLGDKEYSINYVFEILSKRSAFSEDCTWKEFMIICTKGKYKDNQKTRLVSFKDEFAINDVENILHAIKNQVKHNNIISKEVETLELYESTKWTKIFATSIQSIDNILDSNYFEKYGKQPTKTSKTKLNTSNVSIMRGFDSTYSSHLMLPNEKWEIKKINPNIFELKNKELPDDDAKKECTIPDRYLVKAIRKSKDADSLITSANSYVLILPDDLNVDSELDEFVRNYIYTSNDELKMKVDEARKKGRKRNNIITRYKTYKKDGRIIKEIPWFAYARRGSCVKKASHLFHTRKYRPTLRKTLTPYSKDSVSVNAGSLFTVNTFNDLFYASWFNTSLYYYSLFQHHQEIVKHYYEMRIQDFQNVVIPKYSEFCDDKNHLLGEFDILIDKFREFANISDNEVPFLPQQFKENYNPRLALDKVWLKAIGITESEIDIIIDELYIWLIDYLENR